MVDPIYALRKKRMEGMGGEVPAGEVEPKAMPEGEMSEYWQRLQDMDAKLDQILEALGANEQEEVVLPKPREEATA